MRGTRLSTVTGVAMLFVVVGAAIVGAHGGDASRIHGCLVKDTKSPEAIRRAAKRNGLPIERITSVRALDPYFYVPAEVPERGRGRA